jgi:hypothetical protein
MLLRTLGWAPRKCLETCMLCCSGERNVCIAMMFVPNRVQYAKRYSISASSLQTLHKPCDCEVFCEPVAFLCACFVHLCICAPSFTIKLHSARTDLDIYFPGHAS